MIVNFIDRLGTSLLLPFFAFYMTKRFGVGMETVGALFAVWTSSSFIGSFPGGALTDRLGRKGMIILGLVATSLSHLALGLATTVTLFFIFGFIAGIFTDIASPAYQAIVGDLLPEQKRPQGFGILRVAINLSAALGPAIGGFIAIHSYLVLFIVGAAISLVAAVVVFFIVPETMPQAQPGFTGETIAASFGGYLRILRDAPFMIFTAVSGMAWLAYINLSTTLGVYLRNAHGIPETGYGWLLSLNAALVVLFQFPITRRVRETPAPGVDGYWCRFARGWFFNVWILLHLCFFPGCDACNHGWRNDHAPGLERAGGKIRPGRYARPVQLHVQYFLGNCLRCRSIPGRVDHG